MNAYPELIPLRPVLHNNLWGGHRLGTEWGYELPDGPVGECWGISAHPHGDCLVDGGPYAGLTLSRLWDQHRELFGNLEGDRFPLLVKVLDAQDDLSIQVHPDDNYAREHEGGSLGKHECWYVLDAPEDGRIIVGQNAKDRAEFAHMVAENRWDDIVNLVPIRAGDFFDIKPGTLHAIKGGTLILETQQSSDVTYRVYDYGRRQSDGSLRELHLEQAMDVIDYAAVSPTSDTVTSFEKDGVTKLMSCAYFEVLRLRAQEERPLAFAQPYPFLCISVIEGQGAITTPAGSCQVRKGSHLVAPYGSGELLFEGSLTAIVSFVSRP